MTKRLLVFDISNIFLRSYVVNPSLGRDGQDIGGLLGSFSTIQKICSEVRPDCVVIAWDGPGGSRKRKLIDKNYKSGRKPLKLNRNISADETEQEKFANRIWQITRLSEYIEYTPLNQIMLDSVEADDIIAFVCQMKMFSDWNKVIVSSDKDFIQLLDNKTVLYRPTQQEILNEKRVVEKYAIHPKNFVLARSMAGDKSDNLPGIPGIGLPTAASRFPFLAESKDYDINDIVNHCKLELAKDEKRKIKAYENVLEGKEKIVYNYKLMQLVNPQLSIQDADEIKRIITREKDFPRMKLMKLMLDDGCSDRNWEVLFQLFRKLAE